MKASKSWFSWDKPSLLKKPPVRGFGAVLSERLVELPKRATKWSAGYDFYSPFDMRVPARGKAQVDTYVYAYMPRNEYLAVHIRSSLAIKHGLRLENGTGIIDADYRFGKEDGNIRICIVNDSDEDYFIKEGDRIAQGIFMKYYVADDDVVETKRTGGIGSTN